MAAEPIRVLLVDDHAVVRHGLREFLRLQPDIEVAGEAAGGHEAVAVAAALGPDVILLDLVMPDGGGVAALRELAAASPRSRVLVLSSFVEDDHVFAAMREGAAGYLLKDIEPDRLAGAIREVHRGHPALHPDVAAALMRRASAREGTDGGAPLTRRELDVLRLVVGGFANKQIATRLSITEKTVKTHVSNILDKLGVEDRTQAAVVALRRRLVE